MTKRQISRQVLKYLRDNHVKFVYDYNAGALSIRHMGKIKRKYRNPREPVRFLDGSKFFLFDYFASFFDKFFK
jgi:hypothetical protein